MLKQKPAEKEDVLWESDEIFRDFVENANHVICSLDLEGCLRYISPGWKEILGGNPEKLIGASYENSTFLFHVRLPIITT